MKEEGNAEENGGMEEEKLTGVEEKEKQYTYEKEITRIKR